MFQISFSVNYSEIEVILDKLISIGFYSTYYDAPYQVTVDSNGYGFYEKENEVIELKVYPECENYEECEKCIAKIKEVLNLDKKINLIEIKDDNWQKPFEPVDLNNGWIIAEPNEMIDGKKNKINFESQGSFGTGLHETTQDFLRYILEEDFSGLSIFDLGTGSGILSIAAALKNAKKIVALDIRDVTSEVLYNATLNNISNIEVVVADVTSKDLGSKEKFDVVFINIGGEETLASMELINNVIKDNGRLYVSGLVEWSSNVVYEELKAQGYELIKSTKTNEWVTMILEKKYRNK
ncbi:MULTISPECIES: 50S ribosomal protein L11 methyltransferase [Clostridium]|jgi:ribosomal protein L11 methyltransferase|uniref:Ribosomal protein L11 methyltransferase PrmA n=1 Tax=Clostridium saccharoperbutylacetonicum N1-4(HMT) TaxID=931276 RepID=M1ME09_9CLOT|nr:MULTISPECIES: 50S ribosomal protein L11 methyltransferase [Clostridium]AGF54623.1 ribosomal protein L11 methyltransferase PrmA [Clostridium saccharoperbutylacetonicum N1-4(HMT)]AQR93578.1 ribosomal protein L11 methyltransferase [Clostridium saccharoperbutylacetonicum]NRT58856.1 ribosomal protein L11 methyltransferase [Clostridium saccharoperbutylacetonicum]NSB28045.1 ribosomal protein L11 methyltransferase [Clostridium saccharoperbutylacetonicum]NSB29277.1 ribosomal protein L11 methyltransf